MHEYPLPLFIHQVTTKSKLTPIQYLCIRIASRLTIIMLTATLLACLVAISWPLAECDTRYKPNWDSLDTRPLPSWFDEAKFGIFISWGLYAVPGFGNEWFWYNWKTRKNPGLVKFMQDNYPPGFGYEDFAPMFRAELFDPDQWADIIEASGAKYVSSF